MKNKKEAGYCPHNPWVHCSVPDCPACGWHPETAERRLSKIRAKLRREKRRVDNVRKIG